MYEFRCKNNVIVYGMGCVDLNVGKDSQKYTYGIACPLRGQGPSGLEPSRALNWLR